MNFKFYIFILREYNILHEYVTLYPVYVKETGKWLEFEDYMSAEQWVKEQRESGDMEKYQIQKVYMP